MSKREELDVLFLCVFVVAVFDLKASKKCYSCCWHFAILWPFTLGVMGPIKWKSTWVWVRVCVCKSHSYFFCFRLFESRSPFIFSGVDSKSLSLSFCARYFGCCSFFYIIIIKKIVIITCMGCVAVALWVCVCMRSFACLPRYFHKTQPMRRH